MDDIYLYYRQLQDAECRDLQKILTISRSQLKLLYRFSVAMVSWMYDDYGKDTATLGQMIGPSNGQPCPSPCLEILFDESGGNNHGELVNTFSGMYAFQVAQSSCFMMPTS